MDPVLCVGLTARPRGSNWSHYLPPYGGVDLVQVGAPVANDVNELLLNGYFSAFPLESAHRLGNKVFPISLDAEIKKEMPVVVGNEERVGAHVKGVKTRKPRAEQVTARDMLGPGRGIDD